MWIFLDKYIHLVSFILEKVKCIAGPSLVRVCHLAPSTLKVYFWVHKLIKSFTSSSHVYNGPHICFYC
jgi:hypothetical protein